MTTKSGVERAVDAAGNQTKLAEALEVTQQAVSIWVSQGFVPFARAEAIYQLYGIPVRQLVDPRFLALLGLSRKPRPQTEACGRE